jgi:predicted transcriptional regulator
MFTIRLSAADRKALERLAKTEDRTVAGLARKIIADWIRQQPPRNP